MPEELRQRRGKKIIGAAATTSASPTSEKNVVPGDNQPTPIEQLRSAQAKLIISRHRMVDLHAAWKNQLFRISFLVLAVTLYQLQNSVSTCIQEIKYSNNDVDDKELATIGVGATKLIFSHSFSEIVGVLIASCLTYFLSIGLKDPDTPMEMEKWPYMASSALVPLCLCFYFHTKQLGCFAGDVTILDDPDEPKPIRHQFPVVVIYHTIVTVAAWFMKSGLQSAEEHVDLVSDSIRDFERMDKKLALKRQLKSRTRGK